MPQGKISSINGFKADGRKDILKYLVCQTVMTDKFIAKFTVTIAQLLFISG